MHDGEDVMHGDLKDPAVVDRLLQGVDVLVHMAGTSVERPLPEIIQNNLVALHEVYEGARRNGVKRILFASSNHAFGMYPVDSRLKLDAEFRPDGFYGLSKVWGEAMARMYWDKHGIEGVSLRIGTTMGRPPENFRQLSTWMSTEDLVQLVMRAIDAENVGYAAVWGMSANTRSYYDLSEGNAIGYAADRERRRLGRRDPAAAEPAGPSSPEASRAGSSSPSTTRRPSSAAATARCLRRRNAPVAGADHPTTAAPVRARHQP